MQPQADAARRLIEMGGFPHVALKERDLELYILQVFGGDAPPDADGVEVFKRLKSLVTDRKPVLTDTA